MIKKIILFFLFLLVFALPIIGKFIADTEAERVINQSYKRNEEGVIIGAETIIQESNNSKCLLIFTGHFGTPKNFSEFKAHAKKNHYDLVVLRTPYHGMNLEMAKNLNNEVVSKHFENTIKRLSKKYKNLAVMGFSYGGLQLLNLLNQDVVPPSVKVILYAPAVHIITNSKIGYMSTKLYGYFRSYCNYDLPPLLPCKYPARESVDEEGQYMVDQEIGLKYRVIPGIVKMYDLDNKLRGSIQRIKRPFDMIVAKNDNRVHHDILEKECRENKNCNFISFSSGKHVIHYGKRKEEFFKYVSKIIF